MDCPQCNRPVEQQETPEGETRIWCGACGWGTQEAEAEEEAVGAPPAVWQIVLLWIGALIVVIGPYCALRFGLPALFDIGLPRADEIHAKYLTALNGWYGLIMAFYLAAAGLFTPTYDPNNVGWLGGYIDNPFSWQDDWERKKRMWLFMLLPGKLVWMAVKATWCSVRGV